MANKNKEKAQAEKKQAMNFSYGSHNPVVVLYVACAQYEPIGQASSKVEQHILIR